MIQTISPAALGGAVAAIPSKSAAHRLLICAALAGAPDAVVCDGTSRDIDATRACLHAIAQGDPILPCGESGSTLRFLLPVAAALGLDVCFRMEGRLPQRPLKELEEQLTAHGIRIDRPREDLLHISGRLQPGAFALPGNVSSQYISGLLFAMPLLDGPSVLTVTGQLESAPYVDMTLDALKRFGICVNRGPGRFEIAPQSYTCPGTVPVEGDWSNAAFWLCAGALSKPVTVTGLDPDSLQGDKQALHLLDAMGANLFVSGDGITVGPGKLTATDIDAAAIPDLIPVFSVVAAAAAGTTRIYNAGRLRMKESDRLRSICRMLTALGADIRETEDGLLIRGGLPLNGGTVDSCNDHRIAMSAAIASVLCAEPVTVLGAEAVEKSYPHFWSDLSRLQVGKEFL